MQSHNSEADDRLVETLGNMRGARSGARHLSKLSDKVTGSKLWAGLFCGGTIGRAKNFQDQVSKFRSGCQKLLDSAASTVTPTDVPNPYAVRRYYDLTDQFAMKLLEFSEIYIGNQFPGQMTPQSNYAMLEARQEAKRILRTIEEDYMVAHKANGLPFS